jgi:hypothetical protein
MKDPEYLQYDLKEGDCHTCQLYNKIDNKCNHKHYRAAFLTDHKGILYCLKTIGNATGLSYKPGLKMILKKL